MKKGFLFILILLCTISLVGCGSNGDKKKKVKGDGYIVNGNDTDFFDKYEKKSLDKFDGEIEIEEFDPDYLNSHDKFVENKIKEYSKHISYREFEWTNLNNHKLKSIIFYNDDKYAYDATGTFYYTKSDTKEGNYYTSQTDTLRSKLLPNDVLLLTTDYPDDIAESKYKLYIEKLDSDLKKEYLGNDDYSFVKYVKDEENGRLLLYFKYNSNGKNNTTVHLYCVVDNEIVDYDNDHLGGIDEDEEPKAYVDVTKKGEIAVAEFDRYDTAEKLKKCDSFIYFISGFYEK